MSAEIPQLLADRNDARTAFIKARFHRDAAAVYYDSVVTEGATVTRSAWDAFASRQDAMDRAGDRLHAASTGLIHCLLESDPSRGTPSTGSN